MNIVDLIIFIFGCTGLTIILVSSVALEPVRNFVSLRSKFLGKLINCTMCSGFWVGLVASLFTGMNPLWGAAISSLFSWSISSIVEALSTIGFYFDAMLEDGDEDNERNDE
jgi:hypothetical protein